MRRYILLCFIIYYSQAWGQPGNPPPAKPIVGVSGGDRKVTLYWNDLPEQSKDFEGYLILRSTEPKFKEVQLITDGFGNPTYYTPIAQFDKDNLWSGPHPIAVNGIKFNLGENTGIVHTWTDSGHVSGFSLRNGQNYYYVVCSYDRGDSTLGMPPSISNLDVDYSLIYDDSNTVSIIPNAPAPGYVSPKIISDYHTFNGTIYLEYINNDNKEIVDFSYRNHIGDFLYANEGPGTGLISVGIVDPSKIKEDHEYQVVFQDTGYFHETISYSVYNLTTDDTLIKNSKQIHSKDIQQGLVFDGRGLQRSRVG